MATKEFYLEMIREQIIQVQGEINKLKEDIKKRRYFLLRFEDDTEEVVSSDDVEIVKDRTVIKNALKTFHARK